MICFVCHPVLIEVGDLISPNVIHKNHPLEKTKKNFKKLNWTIMEK
jgi:hypothetical protein